MGKISIVTNTKEDIFNFPCEYPIKVFGVNQPDFEKTVCNIVETHIQLNILAPHRLFGEINTRVLPLPDDWPDEPSFNTLESLEAFGNKT